MSRTKNLGPGPGLDGISRSVGAGYFPGVWMPLSCLLLLRADTPLSAPAPPSSSPSPPLNESVLFLDSFQEGAPSFAPVY